MGEESTGATVKKLWREWKGTSQRRYRQWKTRARDIFREKNVVLNGGNNVPPSREVPATPSDAECGSVAGVEQIVIESSAPVCIITEEVQSLTTNSYGTEISENGLDTDKNLFTRKDDPFQPARVAEVLKQVKIGEDLTVEQRASVENLVG